MERGLLTDNEAETLEDSEEILRRIEHLCNSDGELDIGRIARNARVDTKTVRNNA